MTVDYVKFERKLELMSEFDTDYDYSEDRQVMYVMNIPSEHAEDFKLFLEGKYSKFSDGLKAKIIKFWNLKDTESLFYGALYANEAAKKNLLSESKDKTKGEYWDKPVLTREIYTNPS
jgi:hypothetical protein